VSSSQIILDHLDSDQPYHDSLASHFAWLPMAANFDAVNSGYQLWLSEGVNIITNDSLRLEISIIYEKHYKWLRGFLKDRQYNNNQPLLLYMMTKFMSFEHLIRTEPIDYEALKKDHQFKVLVQQNASTIKITLSNNLSIMEDVNDLINDLQLEIAELNQ
jgi:hypothetical protein